MTPTEQDNELRDKLDEQLETLLGFLGDRDDSDNWWGFDTNVGTLEDEIEGNLDSIMQLITAYKDKAVEEVLDRLEKRSDGLPCTVRYSDGSVERMRVIPLSAIEAERAKLKEVK